MKHLTALFGISLIVLQSFTLFHKKKNLPENLKTSTLLVIKDNNYPDTGTWNDLFSGPNRKKRKFEEYNTQLANTFKAYPFKYKIVTWNEANAIVDTNEHYYELYSEAVYTTKTHYYLIILKEKIDYADKMVFATSRFGIYRDAERFVKNAIELTYTK
jgi:hypothetical protein